MRPSCEPIRTRSAKSCPRRAWNGWAAATSIRPCSPTCSASVDDMIGALDEIRPFAGIMALRSNCSSAKERLGGGPKRTIDFHAPRLEHHGAHHPGRVRVTDPTADRCSPGAHSSNSVLSSRRARRSRPCRSRRRRAVSVTPIHWSPEMLAGHLGRRGDQRLGGRRCCSASDLHRTITHRRSIRYPTQHPTRTRTTR